MRQSEIIKYYARRGIGQELARAARDREVVPVFQGGVFGRRPDIIQFASDVKSLARRGATSFHASEERWSNPLRLAATSTKKDLDALRLGFDLILDIDCRLLDYSTIAARLLLDALRHHDIGSFSIKFSGGSGWHISIPFEAMPKKVHGKEVRLLFPEAPRIVAEYLREFIRPHLAEQILALDNDLKHISAKIGKKPSQLIKDGQFDPYSLLEIDTILIAPRHLFRMSYSLHERTWLASVPIKPSDLNEFDPSWAKPKQIEEVIGSFLSTERVKSEEASGLLVQAFDWKEREEVKEKVEGEEKVYKIESYIGQEHFPPCIKAILQGLEDGRKRSLFILTNFLRGLEWPWPDIEHLIHQWNSRNRPPLRAGYLNGQLRWHSKQFTKVPPPNCDSANYYRNIGVCVPEPLCKKVKNPLTYAIRRARSVKK